MASYVDSRGYKRITVVSSRMDKDGYSKEHIYIAEKALGKSLPKEAVVHHIDGNKLNNKNSNLVICENQIYHNLLHRRQRTLNAGGDPNFHKVCDTCKIPKSFSNFYSRTVKSSKYDNLVATCIECALVLSKARHDFKRKKRII